MTHILLPAITDCIVIVWCLVLSVNFLRRREWLSWAIAIASGGFGLALLLRLCCTAPLIGP
jgi:hypothetical protein